MSAPEFKKLYDSARWRRRRADQLRIEPLCRMCKQEGITAVARVADHVTPHRGNLDLFWHGELQSLCFRHHNRDAQQKDVRGFRQVFGPDGLPLDPAHPFNRGR